MPNIEGSTGLAEILQVCCLSRRSGQITFSAEGSSGFVYLLHGRVIHGLCGSLEGEEAIYRMLSWPPGSYALNEEVLPQDTTIVATWEHLILESARRVDQGIDQNQEAAAAPVVTFAPATSARVKGSLPKITVNLADQRPFVYELEAEYTHVGRASGNEVPLMDPSVSNRHCIFILHGSDVVVRDLNSSNGTVVNGQTISEVILRPGDVIQVGVVQMKFEPGVRRPKLTQALPGSSLGSGLSEVTDRLPSRTTLKLPQALTRKPEPEAVVTDDRAFVKGESAISYENLPKPEEKKKSPRLFLIVAVVLTLLLVAGIYYFFFLHPAR